MLYPPINCIILDDEPHCVDTLSQDLALIPAVNLLLATSSISEALNAIRMMPVHLLFLDVQMEDMSGIEVARLVGDKCKIVLTTAHGKYALDSYELNVVDFLLKPVTLPRLLRAIRKVQDILHPPPLQEQDFFYIKTGSKNNVIQISLDAIDYIEGTGNYVHIYHEGRKTGIYQSLKEMEMRLPQAKFIRVNRSCIVPFSRIARAEGGHVILRGINKVVMLGGTYKNVFWEKIKSKTI